ncbi:MAG TPA: hypothetical protein VGM75_13150, partial [Pseudonocardiaceae bacterium]
MGTAVSACGVGIFGSASGAPLAPVPTAAAGTVVTGTLNVDSNTSASNQFPDGSPDPGALETIAAL